MALTETVTLRPKVRNATNLFLSLKTLSWNPEAPAPTPHPEVSLQATET